jgi:ectoine hydroxylase-related dioxygenase (phytanoyl-CoA dioxygenase family)
VGRVFVLLAPVRPEGGGTLIAAGSHRIVQALAERRGSRMSSLEMRQALAADHPWFADLMGPPKDGEDRLARFVSSSTMAGGVPLQVEEITGEPGDVFLMHPHTLHGLSANTLDTPRLALTQTIYPKAWSGAY